MIKVTKGTVGVTINGRNTTRSYEDAPFSLDKETEARFVALGVAEYYTTGAIGPGAQETAEAQEKTAESTEEAPTDDTDDDTLESMGFKELQKLAKQMGLSASGKREDIIARINEANQVTM